jgi:hemoglobin-like flavoprotein
MAEQGRKLMTMIGTAVANLHRLVNIVPTVQDLGRRHIGYGVEPTHYQTVSAAMPWTLEQDLGDQLNLELMTPGGMLHDVSFDYAAGGASVVSSRNPTRKHF